MSAQTIRHGGEQKSLEAWGIKAPTVFVTHAERGQDALEFTTDERLGAAPVFTPLGRIEFFDADGNRQFDGVVMDPVRVLEGGPSGRVERSYVCAPPTYYLASRQFGQDWIVTEEDLVPGEMPTLTPATLTIVRIGRDETPVTIAAAVEQIADAGAPIDLDDSYVPGDEDDEGKTPEDRQTGLTCLGAINKALECFPYVSWRWDFSGGGVSRIEFFSTLRPGHDIGDLPASQLDVETVDAGDVEGLRGGALHKLLISKMTVHFIDRQRLEFDGGRIIVGKRWTYEATKANGAFRQETHTIDLRPAYWDGTEYIDAEQPIATLARQIGAAFFYPPYTLSWREKGATPNWNRRPCALFNATGADPDLEEAHAYCRSVRHNCFTGETAVECGPVEQPGIDAIADLLRKLANRKPPTAEQAGGQTVGFEPQGDEGGAGATNMQVEVWVRNTTTGALTRKWVNIAGEALDPSDTSKEYHLVKASGSSFVHVRKVLIGSETTV